MHEESMIEMKLKEESRDLCDICETLEDAVRSKLGNGIEKANTKEMGEVVDMIKDLYEAKEKLYKACYYKYLMETMEEDKKEREEEKKQGGPMRMYYPVQGSRTGGGNSGGMRGMGGMWEPEMDYERGMMDRSRRGGGNSGDWNDTSRGTGRSNGSRQTRYGFSFDNYMDAREMYQANDPDQERMRMESLNRDLDELVEMSKEVVHGMTPGEKQAWKSKISKILNA